MAEFTLKIDGNVKPDTIDISDLGGIIRAFRKILGHYARTNYNTDYEKSLKVVLDRIEEGSACPALQVSDDEVHYFGPVLAEVGKEMASGFANAERGLGESVGTLRSIAEINNYSYELFDLNRKSIAKWHPKPLSQNVYKGDTDLVATVISTGGKTPRIYLQPHTQGSHIKCETSEEMAQKAGHLLYQDVFATGIGIWNAHNDELLELELASLRELPTRSSQEIFAELSQEFGSAFKDVDPDEFVTSLRKNGED